MSVSLDPLVLDHNERCVYSCRAGCAGQARRAGPTVKYQCGLVLLIQTLSALITLSKFGQKLDCITLLRFGRSW